MSNWTAVIAALQSTVGSTIFTTVYGAILSTIFSTNDPAILAAYCLPDHATFGSTNNTAIACSHCFTDHTTLCQAIIYTVVHTNFTTIE